MRLATAFALVALVPAAANAGPPAGVRMLSMALCNGGSVGVPAGPPPRSDGGCCLKACHAGGVRRRHFRVFDLPQ